MTMTKNEKPDDPIDTKHLVTRPCFTTFDLLHLALTFLPGLYIAKLILPKFGLLWAFLAVTAISGVLFLPLGYAFGALVLYIHRRYSSQSRLGHEAACYVLSHFTKRT